MHNDVDESAFSVSGDNIRHNLEELKVEWDVGLGKDQLLIFLLLERLLEEWDNKAMPSSRYRELTDAFSEPLAKLQMGRSDEIDWRAFSKAYRRVLG